MNYWFLEFLVEFIGKKVFLRKLKDLQGFAQRVKFKDTK